MDIGYEYNQTIPLEFLRKTTSNFPIIQIHLQLLVTQIIPINYQWNVVLSRGSKTEILYYST